MTPEWVERGIATSDSSYFALLPVIFMRNLLRRNSKPYELGAKISKLLENWFLSNSEFCREMKPIRRIILRWQMKRALQSGRRVSISEATRLWSLSDTIYIGPVGPSARILPECEIFRRLAGETDVEDNEIRGLLQHKSPSVAGYGLELLIRRKSGNLQDAVNALAERREKVTMGLTCFVCYSPLCEYAANRIKAEQGGGGNSAALRASP